NTQVLLMNEPDYEILHGKARAILWRDQGRGGWDVPPTDPCPFCRTRHNHSGGEGHRRAHCASAKMNPTFTCTDGTIVYATDGYIIRIRLTPRNQRPRARMRR